MSDAPLMPKATAVWLVDNTGLSFQQIADFCHLHELEVKAIADEESAQGIKGLDPITNGQLLRDDIEKGEADPAHKLKLAKSKTQIPIKRTRGPRYTPVSRRQDRPNAILWLVRNHPELADAQIIRLVGTTKPTIQAIRERTHWNSASLQPLDPVTLGLCSQIDLDFEVQRAAKRAGIEAPEPMEEGPTLRPAEETTAEATAEPDSETDARDDYETLAEDKDLTADSVFAKLATLKKPADEDEDLI
ncbi:MAG: cell cycle transcriptional regulator TrcR [Pseudomonadota bacterium]